VKARRLVIAASLFAATCLVVATAATASSNTPVACGNGKLIVNVTYQLINDYDSAVGGNAWANDTVTRHLQVFDLGGGSYCATVNDTGSFLTFAGASPGGTGVVAAGIKGVINGGYVTTTFTGTLNTTQPYAMKGNLGTFDLQCTDAYNCPGAHPGYYSYFSATSGDDLTTWGWTYRTAKNGDWTNASTGNAGDIVSGF
jgi:hypothetical protein